MLSIAAEAASCLSCHSPRPELPASFEILPAVSNRVGEGQGKGLRGVNKPLSLHTIGLVSLTYTAPSHTTIHQPKKKLLLLAISTHVNNFHHYNRGSVFAVSLQRISRAHIHTQVRKRDGYRAPRHTTNLTPCVSTCIGVVWPRGLRNQVLLLVLPPLLPPLLLPTLPHTITSFGVPLVATEQALPQENTKKIPPRTARACYESVTR